MYTLSNLMRDHLIDQGAMRTSLATGGSTTTVEDTERDPTESERQWKNGTIIILRDAAGAGAAPEQEFGRISAFSSGVFTVETAFSSEVDAGDRYGVAPRTVEHQMLIELANAALVQLGHIGYTDYSITTESNRREYTLPSSAKRMPVRVWIQSSNGGSNNNGWKEIDGWRTDWTSPGAGALIFDRQPPAGRGIALEYYDVHPRLDSFDDEIYEVIHPYLARASMTERVANYLSQQAQQTDQPRRDAWNRALAEYEKAIAKHPIRKPMPQPALFIVRDDGAYYPGDPGVLG